MPVYLPGFHEVPARWFRGHKVGLHGPGAVQHVGLHYVVVERDEKYMASFDEMVPEFIEKMDEALAEIGFVFGEQWR